MKQSLKSCDASQLLKKDMRGHNLGTPALKQHRQATKLYQNDTVSQEKPIANIPCKKQEKGVSGGVPDAFFHAEILLL